MPKRNKTIFISDIHLGDQRSWEVKPHPYCWCMDNIGKLGNFLTETQKDSSVKELVILGDLFDTWIIPVDSHPLASFKAICDNPHNRPVIDNLKDQKAWANIQISYVLGNHDMAITPEAISDTQQFMQEYFPHIKCLFKEDDPLGKYETGLLLAEHGNRYGLFNGPDKLSNPPSFLPIGYFISRLVGTKEQSTGRGENYLNIAIKFFKQVGETPNFIVNLFKSIAKDAGLGTGVTINTRGLPPYNSMETVETVGDRFSNLMHNLNPGNVGILIGSDTGNLWLAAERQFIGGKKIAIFGHTHNAEMAKKKDIMQESIDLEKGIPIKEIPSLNIYANCGSWVDKSPAWFNEVGGYGKECSYVETEEIRDDHKKELRIYARVKTFPGHKVIDEGFVREILV